MSAPADGPPRRRSPRRWASGCCSQRWRSCPQQATGATALTRPWSRMRAGATRRATTASRRQPLWGPCPRPLAPAVASWMHGPRPTSRGRGWWCTAPRQQRCGTGACRWGVDHHHHHHHESPFAPPHPCCGSSACFESALPLSHPLIRTHSSTRTHIHSHARTLTLQNLRATLRDSLPSNTLFDAHGDCVWAPLPFCAPPSEVPPVPVP
jgi:hypothetical protein